MPHLPIAQDVHECALRLFQKSGTTVRALTRCAFATTAAVYDVTLADERRTVLRMEPLAGLDRACAYVFWNFVLRKGGLPLPELLHVDLDGLAFSVYPFVVMERVVGRELGLELLEARPSAGEVERLFGAAFELHGMVASLGVKSPGFSLSGLGPDGGGRLGARPVSWPLRFTGFLQGLAEPKLLELYHRLGSRYELSVAPYVDFCGPTAVMVESMALRGLCGIRELHYGDPGWPVGCLRAFLAASGLDPAWIRYLGWRPTSPMVRFYSAVRLLWLARQPDNLRRSFLFPQKRPDLQALARAELDGLYRQVGMAVGV